MDSITSDTVAEAAQRGDHDAWSQIDQVFRPRLLQFLRRRIPSGFAIEAEDWAQEILSLLYRKRHLLPVDRPILPYMWRCASNWTISRIRALSRQVRASGTADEMEFVDEKDEFTDFVEWMSLQQAIEQLSDCDRLTLGVIARSETLKDAARELHLSESGVRKRRTRVINAVRRLMGDI